MNKDNQNWTDVTEFFNSQLWDDICDEAIQDEHQPSEELMNDMLLRFKSAVFYAANHNLTRFNKEIEQLSIITRHLTKTL